MFYMKIIIKGLTVHEYDVRMSWVPDAAILIVEPRNFATCTYYIYKDHIFLIKVCRERSSSLSKRRLKTSKTDDF